MFYTMLASPVGELLLAGDKDALRTIGFPTSSGAVQPDADWERNPAPFVEATRQLEDYFAGKRRTFDLSLAPTGTPFQRDVLTALQQIPYGETRSYGDLAKAIGRPKASRAVGAANGSNPLPIVIPCHRVIGSDGSLTGFGGGLETKRFLLDLEQRHAGGGSLRRRAGTQSLL